MEEYMGIIKIFGGNFAPVGWAFCNGQIMSIAQNTALFSILGTTYGGDGVQTFALPDLRSRVPLGGGMGAAPGLPSYDLGQAGGEANHTLISSEMPSHNHGQMVSSANASQTAATAGATIATPGTLSGRTFTATNGFNTSAPDTALNATSVKPSGGSQPHNNMQPYLGSIYIICTEGIYPSRN